MKKKFLTALLAAFCMMTSAQNINLGIKSITCSQAQDSNPISNAYDGNTSTFWHSPWGGTSTTFPVSLIITLSETSHVDLINYIGRSDGNSNGHWGTVEVQYRTTAGGTKYTTAGTYDLGKKGSGSMELGKEGVDGITHIKLNITSGQGNYASAAEIQAVKVDRAKEAAFKKYFTDPLFTQLKSDVTSADGIADADIKALVNNLLSNATKYKKFRVGEYEAYRTTSSLRSELRTNSQYTPYENPTGIYANEGEPMIVAIDGIGSYPVTLTVKNWVENERESSYSLKNGLNFITPSTTGNCFITYYTDNYKDAPKVSAHFINGQIQGYWNQQTMTNEDWKEIIALHPSTDDKTVIICQSEHAQTAYPAYIWRQNCPTNIDSVMTMYQQVQWAERDIMGLNKYGRQAKNRQLFYGSNYGFMAAGGNSAYCNVNSLGAITKPDSKNFDFWGVGHEWGHNNQITPGFKWSGCGETTNNIYASWAQIHFTGNPSNLRLEDERSGINEYGGTRGGRMQTYFEEGLRKGVQWQLQDGPDYHGTTPTEKVYNGKTYLTRNYDHFVKLVPFWQLNLWGTLAGKCPDIIPMVIEGLRNTPSSTLSSMDNGTMQVNWMKMACDSAKINLIPFFEKAGMFKEIDAWIEDYGAGLNKITKQMLDNVRNHVKQQGYPDFTEEINYINGHNYHIYRDCLELKVPATTNSGCTPSGNWVKVDHSQVQNAVAYETYNSNDQLIRITMYGLNADDNHTYTMVLYPGSEDAAYIVAVGYNGTRKKIFTYTAPHPTYNKYYRISSKGKGGYLTSGSSTQNATTNEISWSINRNTTATDAASIWFVQKEEDGGIYLYNPQSDSYLSGKSNVKFTEFSSKSNRTAFAFESVNEAQNTWAIGSNGHYLNAYTATETGYWSGGASDDNNIWTITPVESYSVSMPTSGVATLMLPFAVEIPNDLTAYIVTGTKTVGSDNFAVVQEIPGHVIPANTPVILKGTGKQNLKLLTDNDTKAPEGNLLRGSNLSQTGLTKGTIANTVGTSTVADAFAKLSASSSASSLAANKSYLPVTAGSSAYNLIIESTTDIATIKGNNDTDTMFFTIDGKPAGKLQHGQIYVTSNGEKIMYLK